MLNAISSEEDPNMYILDNCSYLRFIAAVRVIFDYDVELKIDRTKALDNKALDKDLDYHDLAEQGLKYKVYQFKCNTDSNNEPTDIIAYITEK